MSKRKILFVDRDGTLIIEPEDFQIDRLDKLALVEGVIPALLELQAAGYELVMVSNQDGLGTASFPQSDFDGPQQLMLQIFESQGITFSAIHIDPSMPEERSPNRKPGIGMLLPYLKDGSLDLNNSFVIGDRETDLQLAHNMEIGGLRIAPRPGDEGLSWPEIVSAVLGRDRTAKSRRDTNETQIGVRVNLDQGGPVSIDTGIGFFDHMLEQLCAHGGFALSLECKGDLHIDEHHTVEDCALALGQCLSTALGDKRGIGRYGFTVPMDESLAEAAIDLSGRPSFNFSGAFSRDQVGGLSTEMVRHFFLSLTDALRCSLHLSVTGDNAHHMVEACFKATGRALRQAFARSGSVLPSTKGVL